MSVFYDSMKDLSRWRKYLQPSSKNFRIWKTWKFSSFFLFESHFGPLGSKS